MTHQVKGVVDTCTQRDQKTRNGIGQIHGCIVDGVEFETGFQKKHSEGEMISVAVKWDYGKWNEIPGNDGSGMPAATAGGMAKPKPAGGPGGGFKGNSRTFPVPPTDGAISIIRQNSMGHATRVVEDMVSQGVVPTPACKEDYFKILLETALVITDFSSGQDVMQMQAAVAANKAVMDE